MYMQKKPCSADYFIQTSRVPLRLNILLHNFETVKNMCYHYISKVIKIQELQGYDHKNQSFICHMIKLSQYDQVTQASNTVTKVLYDHC